MPVSFRQLQILEAVVQSGSLTSAAERMLVSQPAVSKSIAALEAQTGFSVFQRNGNRLVLTERGHALLLEGRRLLDMMENFDGIIADIRERGLRRIRIATTSMLATAGFLTDAVATFCRQYPQVRLQIETLSRQEIARAALGGRADVMIGYLPFSSAEIETRRFGASRIVAVAAPGLFLAGRHSLSMAELTQLPLITLFQRSRLRRVLDQSFYRAGVEADLLAEVSISPIALELARRGLGVAICDEIALMDADRESLDRCHLEGNPILEIGFVARRGEDQLSYYEDELEEMIVASWRLAQGK